MKMRSHRISRSVAHGIALLCALATSAPMVVQAAGVVGTGSAASCTDAALNAALAGGGLVTFNCGAGPATITITGTMEVAVDTTIDGGGTITFDGETSTGVLLVETGVTLFLQNLMLHGSATLVNSSSAIRNNGTLMVSDCMLAGNLSFVGGAINNAGTLTITDSSFSGNAALSGGAVLNVGTMTVTTSTFAGNGAGFSATATKGCCGDGGAISNGGTLTIVDSTFSGNGAIEGGGIFNGGTTAGSGILTVINSTFSGNHSDFAYRFGAPIGGGYGGAIYSSGTLQVTDSTLSGNSAAAASGGASIFITNQGGAATVTNTIIAASTGGNCSGASIVDGGHNLQFPGTDCGASIRSADPQLDPAGLRDNGGPTHTLALLPGSPAIDAGDAAVCAAAPVNNRDQRGFVRPGIGHTNCSIGAYEFNSPGPLISCVGDCNGNGAVTIDELISTVNIALGNAQPAACVHGVLSGISVTVAVIIQAVNNALTGCTSVCGNARVEPGADCDDGGTCIGSNARTACTAEAECLGTGVCMGGAHVGWPVIPAMGTPAPVARARGE